MHKARRAKGLSWFEKMLNSFWGKTRSAVERIFGHFKTGMGLRGSRYKGVEKHQVHFDLMAIAYNLRRATVLLSI
jgi:IS5 family transposase